MTLFPCPKGVTAANQACKCPFSYQVWRSASGGVVGPGGAISGVELGHVERGGLHELVLVLGAEDEAAHGHDDGDQGQDYDAGRNKERIW